MRNNKGRETNYLDPKDKNVFGYTWESFLNAGFVYAPYIEMKLTPILWANFYSRHNDKDYGYVNNKGKFIKLDRKRKLKDNVTVELGEPQHLFSVDAEKEFIRLIEKQIDPEILKTIKI